MELGLSGTVLTRDLVAADGRLVASRGEVVDLTTLKDVASRAPRGLREKPLFETTHAEAVLEAFDSAALQHLAGREAMRALAADVLADVRFPQPIWDELEALRHQDGPRYQHAIYSGIAAAPAVHFALLHHTRAGWGYPRVQTHPPLRGLDLVSVSGAFAAMVSPRSFRLTPFSPRGAVDQLIDDAEAGHFDPRAVRLLVHCLRGGAGSIQELQLPRKHTG